MRVLLINICGAEGVVAVAKKGRVVGVAGSPGRAASEHLVTAIRGLLVGAGWAVKDLTAVGVVVGPGSFTGMRVGLSAAKGLCEAGGVGMVAMSRLALVAGEDGVALLDAGRGEYYCGVYRRGVEVSEELVKGTYLEAAIATGRAVTSEERVADALGIRLVAEPGAEQMLVTVRRRVEAGEWSDVAATDANYLRRTDAELNAAGRLAG